MARAMINNAIEIGVPAYNAGQIALCAAIYEQAAARLLREQVSSLTPSVAKALEQALFKASSATTRSDAKGSEADGLAWALRRAFDEQLRAAPEPRGAARTASAIIARAISEGVPAYNSGDVGGCARLYAETARRLLQGGLVDAASRQALERALEQCRQLPDADARAWALRRALDSARGGQSGSADARKASAGGLLRDFAREAGLQLAAAVVNDTVMGGRSDGRVAMTDQGAVFEGQVTRRGGGGFASVRFTPADGAAFARLLRSGSGLALTVRCVRGCAAWKVQLTDSSGLFRGGTQWQADFTAPAQEGQVRVPFSSMEPSFRGRRTGSTGLPSSSMDGISSFGFMLSFLTADGRESNAFQEGSFALSIKSVEVF